MKTKMRNHWQITYRGQLVHETTQPQRFLNSAAARDIERKLGRNYTFVLRCTRGPKTGESYDYGL